MKIQILDKDGKKKGEIDTRIFDNRIREEIIQRVVEAEKIRQPYAPFYLAGKQASASGKIRHARRRWKTAYGKGISRVPRKIFWRRGTQFYWQAATISSTRGGRRAHPPKIFAMLARKKINKKEKKLAFLSALALITKIDKVKEKYSTLKDRKIEIKLPIVIEEKVLSLKTKDFFILLRKILDGFYEIAIRKKSIRAGKGKSRGRKYKKSAGLLFVVSKDEKRKISGIEIKKVGELCVGDLASNGARLVIFTENSIKDLENRLLGKSEEEKNVKTNNK